MRVDFYILADDSPDARERLSCRLAEKAWKQGHSIYLHADTPTRAAHIDDLLWTFRDGSFVPHARIGDSQDPTPPVLIGSGSDAPANTDVLINLDDQVPGFYGRFTRIAEIVGAEEPDRRAGRDRFRFYREQGLTPHSHQI